MVFVQVAERGSLAEAARQLGVSASAVGKTLTRLEERLGVRLLNRSTRSMALTPEGERFLERCRRIFAEVDAAEEELAATKEVPQGRLRVSLPLVESLLASSLAGFARAYPRVVLDLDFTDRLVDVIEEGFDVVLRTGEATDSRLRTRIVGSYSHVIVASPEYLARHGTPTIPEDLSGHACLLHRWATNRTLDRWPLWRDGSLVELELPATAVATVIEPLIHMAERGVGLACVPSYAVRRQLENGSLVEILADATRGDRRSFRILWPAGRHTAPKVRAFVDFMATNVFESSPAMPQV